MLNDNKLTMSGIVATASTSEPKEGGENSERRGKIEHGEKETYTADHEQRARREAAATAATAATAAKAAKLQAEKAKAEQAAAAAKLRTEQAAREAAAQAAIEAKKLLEAQAAAAKREAEQAAIAKREAAEAQAQAALQKKREAEQAALQKKREAEKAALEEAAKREAEAKEIAENGKGTGSAKDDGPKLTSRFLEHMFLDDLLVLEGSKVDDAVRNFNLCVKAETATIGSALGALGVRGDVLVPSAPPGKSAVSLNVVTSNGSRLYGLDAVRYDWSAALGRYVDAAAPATDNEVITKITPLGYYYAAYKTGHHFAVLVHVRGDRAIVAVADTGETALPASLEARDLKYAGGMAIVVLGLTDRKGAAGILEFARNISPVCSTSDDAKNARRVILQKCGVDVDGNAKKMVREPHAELADRWLAVRWLLAANNTIVSHPQRGGTCTFYSILWLLGIASALEREPTAVDFIIESASSAQAAHAASRSGFLLACVRDVDKEIKRLAFRLLLAGKHPAIAELVAADYAGCSWLDTRTLRDTLWRVQPPTEDAALIIRCSVTLSVKSGLPSGTVAASLGALAKWIVEYGNAAATDWFKEGPARAAFVHMARDLLMKPVTLGSYRFESNDAEHIRVISMYAPFIRAACMPYYTGIGHGMAMRCARYITEIVRRKINEYARGKISGEGTRRVVLPVELATPLPWVAAEYYALQAESAAITHLLFDEENMESLAKSTGESTAVVGWMGSSNDFHKEWKGGAELKKAGLEEQMDAAAVEDQWQLQTQLKKLRKLSAQIDFAASVELTEIQDAALTYLRSRVELAVLNVVVAILVAEIGGSSVQCVDKHHAVFGFVEASGVRFIVSVASTIDARGYDEDRTLAVALVSSLDLGHSSRGETHAEMSQNMEYMYDATRDCAAKTRRVHVDENAELKLILRYPNQSAHLDVDSLVQWANADTESCVYDWRGVDYLIRRHVMPLSANGPSNESFGRLKLRLENLRKQPAKSDDALGLENLMRLIGGSVERADGIRPSNLINDAYLTVAVHTGKLDEFLLKAAPHAKLQPTPSVTTNPDSSWSLTRLEMRAGDTKLVDATKGTFVFGGTGGGMAMVHRRLVAGGCAFDHWQKGEGSRIEMSSGATIESTSSEAAAELKVTLVALDESDPEHTKTLTTAHVVFTAHSQWWDETHKAAVLPIGTTRVERLVVIPGSRSSAKCKDYPVVWATDPATSEERALLGAYEESLPKRPFVVELDVVGLLPAASTGTDELVLLFRAYAYAGSRLGTRMMPSASSRSIYGEREISVAGFRGFVHDAIRAVIHGANCPLGSYSAYALLRAGREPIAAIARHLRCTESDMRSTLVERLRVHPSARDHAQSVMRRARFSFWAEYGEAERRLVFNEVLRKTTDEGERSELTALYEETDEWMTTLSATTGRFVRRDQREKLDMIAREPWSVVQMQMGFGKSSVIVPMLVARCLCAPAIRIVFVTQPPHLVRQAALAVGALVAAHPYVDIDGASYPVYAINVADLRGLVAPAAPKSTKATGSLEKAYVGGMGHKLVVVLCTADMQCVVRDFCGIYTAHEHIAHIADEVDAESDPMRCEVIIEGGKRHLHYLPKVAEADNIKAYYAAASALGYEAECDTPARRDELAAARAAAAAAVVALDALCDTGVQAGTRLRNVFASVRKSMIYRVHYGMPDDDAKLIAVPFDYAATPSPRKEFSDFDVLMAALVLSIEKGMRPSDLARLYKHIRARFKSDATSILQLLQATPELGRRYYMTEIAMRVLRTSTRESSVAFSDVMGVADKLVGFSGTMAVGVVAPVVAADDPRASCSGKLATVIVDEKGNRLVDAVITRARCIFVGRAEPGVVRAMGVLDEIRGEIRTGSACIVDGSGEFGAFQDDLVALRGFWPDLEYFGKDGLVLKEGARVRYYSHRDSRGVDSVMPLDTTGFTVMCPWTSTRDKIAQAIFRLRMLTENEEASQKVVLVVVLGATGEVRKESGESDGAAVLRMLRANQVAYAASCATLHQEQLAHAAIPKVDASSFERAVVYGDVARAAQTERQSEKEEVGEVEREVETTRDETKTLTRAPGLACYEKTNERDDAKLNLSNHETVTGISESLAALRIGLSPMITIKALAGEMGIRRAFAVGADDSLVVLAIVEAWAKYAHDEHDNVRASSGSSARPYAYYTHDGAFIMGAKAREDGRVLLGRFLCDDPLGIAEEITLLKYLATKDAGYTGHLTVVLECLFTTGFISTHSLLLTRLASESATIILRDQTAADITARIALGNDAIYKLFLPIVSSAVGTAFGRPRSRNSSGVSRRATTGFTMFV
jgi:hypothetical protein